MNNESPKSPELKQFDAFLKRELPRTIRKRLQVYLERSFGPIEETIKNELEGIVRDAQEALTRGFLGTTPPEHSHAETKAGSAREEINTWQLNVSQAGPSDPRSHVQPQMDALAPYFVPPDATGTGPSSTELLTANDNAVTTLSDSAYYSLPTQDLQFDEDWLNTIIDDSTWNLSLDQHSSEEIAHIGSRIEWSTEEVPQTSYTGKGKGKAAYDTVGANSEDTDV